MSKLKKTFLVLTLSSLIGVSSMFDSAYALSETELQNKLTEISAENRKLDGRIEEIKDNISYAAELKQLYRQKAANVQAEIDYWGYLLYENERQIAEIQAKLDVKALQIAARELRIDKVNAEIIRLTERNDENLKKFGKLTAALYMSGGADYINLLTSKNDFYDFFVVYEMTRNISEQTLKFMNETLDSVREREALCASLSGEKAALEKDGAAFEAEKSALADKQRGFDAALAENKAACERYRADYDKYAGIIEGLESEKSDIENRKKINQAEAEAFERQLQEIIRSKQSGNEYADGAWLWPVEKRFTRITTYFGYDEWRNSSHYGIDIAGAAGGGGADINWTNIYAAKTGIVVIAQHAFTPGYSYGKYIVIDHGGGYTSLYGHCNDIYVSAGQKVDAGQAVGAIGSTGFSTGPHLHFEIRKDGAAENPLGYY